MLFYGQDVLIDSFGHNYSAQVSWEHAQTCDMLRSGLMKLDLGYLYKRWINEIKNWMMK